MHDRLEVPLGGLYIGRDPTRANLIFKSNKISALHVHLSPHQFQQQLWVEDLNSLNGTFYLQVGTGADPRSREWIRLKGKVLLTAGAHLRLADDVAEFEIRKA
jgi:pSer/pThr/pTyr-binding forkhead associated (FHA) protein